MTLSKFQRDRGQGVREALALSVPGRWQMDHITLRSRRNRYFFYVTMANQLTLKALYDPGAEASCLKASVYNQWPLKNQFPGVPSNNLTGAFGHRSDQSLKIRVPTAAVGQQHDMTIYVVDGLNCDFIAGSDFVHLFELSLDASRKKLISPETIHVSPSHSAQVGPYECSSITMQLCSPKTEELPP